MREYTKKNRKFEINRQNETYMMSAINIIENRKKN